MRVMVMVVVVRVRVFVSVFVHVVGVTRSGITRSTVGARVVAVFTPAWRLVGAVLHGALSAVVVMMMRRCMLTDRRERTRPEIGSGGGS